MDSIFKVQSWYIFSCIISPPIIHMKHAAEPDATVPWLFIYLLDK